MNAAYGTWTSPWAAESITATDKIPDLVDVVLDPITSVVYHIEKRPAEGGRNALVHSETRRDVLGGGDWDVRSSVNGYGGAPAIVHGGVAYFSHGRDGRVYKINVDDNKLPEAITPENPFHKFANFNVYPGDPGLLVGVLEDHTGAKTPAAVVNSLCILNVSTKEVLFPVTSDDASFYASPTFSPDGKRVAWVEWDLPDMPWNGTEIWVADVVPVASPESLSFVNPRHVAGHHGKISVAYPSWLSNDVLLFTCDVSGFENPWTYDCIAAEASAVFKAPVAQSFSYGSPPKVLGWSPYAPVDDAVVFIAIKDGRSVLYRVDIAAGTADLLPSPYTVIQHLRTLAGNQVVFVGTQADAPPALIRCTLSSSSTEAVFTPILSSDPHNNYLPREYISLPQPISIPLPAPEAGFVHVVFYAPTNPGYAAPDGEKPPLVIHVHGGPVGFSAQAFDRTRLFFTTRGWAWCDVNYGGSSGYGRGYMERLRGNWGVVDVEDCICAARALASAPYNLVDPKRIVVRGPSAGGFTVLSALSRYAEEAVFAAGASLYGISDLRRLERETHKFESGYLRMLVGDDPEVLVDRSPVSHADKITVPSLILQGDSDTAVPPSQAEGMVESIRKRGGVVEYKLYAGEGHGWKRRETIEDAIQTELQFYNRVLGIESY
ncbi:alpha/beta-hydrolase [Roridomyces roridus]|uniref:Alpha/beta-hydrolase n=1 Tax=Roridomyces roridus TaxID=1738132 RepID=A0AAD7C7Q5_9AGAR|nr:alpha/beta-hydrolase [Roridomyces roridus]